MLTSGAFEDRRTSEGRLVGLRVMFIASFAVLVVVFWLLQVLQNAKYEGLADSNYLRTIPLRAPRGVLFDRHGRVLVENRYSFTIAIVREGTTSLDATITKLASATGVPEANIREALERRRRDPLFRPIPVIEHATFEQVAAIEVRRRELPEVLVQQVPTRAYPPDGLAAHLFGYVGEIQEPQLAQEEFSGLNQGAIIGQAGLERTYNSDLQGVDGDRYVIVNSRGREIDELNEVPPIDGRRLQLTVDYDVQRALEDGFRAGGFNGAAAILDPNTGEIFAMASLPAYDPNAFAIGLDGAAWSRLVSDPLRPMTNRLIQGTYSPGSTFKIVMAVAGLEEGVITPSTTFYCPGYGTFYGRAFRCNRPSGHGTVDLRHALEVSCNVYFYNVGDRLKIDQIHHYASSLGLTGRTGVDLPGENESLVPSTEWKQRTFKQPWYPGETISVAIGQGAVSVTPMALATMIATVANGGTLVTPHLVRATDAGDGRGWQFKPTPSPRATLSIPRDSLEAVRDGLWRVVNGAGTGGRARVPGRDVAGKTGTSQVVSLQNRSLAAGKIDVRDNGWFVFFAPRDNPEIAGVVFVEHGLHGSSAAPIARHVIETFFAKKEGQPLPSLTPPPQAPPTPPPAAPAPDAPAPPPTGPVARADGVRPDAQAPNSDSQVR
jgi:penicillin-binding protein 2